jgi:hypothetical protein
MTMNGQRVVKLGATVLLGAIAPITAAASAQAASAPSAGTRPAIVHPLYWYDSGVSFSSYYECMDWAAKALSSGNFAGTSCIENADGSWELWLDSK